MTQDEMINNLIRYESEGLDDDELIEFFQHLVDTGLAWSLQGHYGRTAAALIEEGYIHAKDN